jgi:hypothetical protein
MLLDISGNTFSALGNTAPTVIYQPQQIFGTGLTIWYDFNDRSVLFTNTAATINVSATNDIIRYVINKGNNPNYNLISLYPTQTSLTSNNSVLPFKLNDLNTNKNSNFISFTGGTGNSGFGVLGSISSNTTTTQPSAFTFSSAFRTHSSTSGLNTIIGGFHRNKVPYIVSTNSTTLNFIALWSTAAQTSFSIPIAAGERYHYFTLTVNSSNTVNLIFNNLKYTGTTGTNIFPIVSSTAPSDGLFLGRFYLGYYQGNVITQRTNPNSEYLEIVISYNTILTDDQIYKLHQYYKTKYNLR